MHTIPLTADDLSLSRAVLRATACSLLSDSSIIGRICYICGIYTAIIIVFIINDIIPASSRPGTIAAINR